MAHDLIAIVDDDEALRLSTSMLLERAGFQTRLFGSGDNFLTSPGSEPFSCVLLDMQMPGSNGFAVLGMLRDRGESPPVLVITGHGDIAAAVEAMKLGAHDFLEKPYQADALLAAIRLAVEGSLKSADARTIRDEARALLASLSERQTQVLQGILKGLQNKIIAHELGLSIRTVEAYRSQLLVKLRVRGTAEAVRLALAAGLIEGTHSVRGAPGSAQHA